MDVLNIALQKYNSLSQHQKNCLKRLLPDIEELSIRSKKFLFVAKDKLHLLAHSLPPKKRACVYNVITIINGVLESRGDWEKMDDDKHVLTDHAFIQYLKRFCGWDVVKVKNMVLRMINEEENIKAIKHKGKIITVWEQK